MTVVFTGVQPGYTKNTLTLYDQIKHGSHTFDFWTASDDTGTGKGVLFNIIAEEYGSLIITGFGKNRVNSKEKQFLVRPVLNE